MAVTARTASGRRRLVWISVPAQPGPEALRGRYADAAKVLLRTTYAYPEGGSTWDSFPEAWRQIARENARATLADFRNSTAHAAPFDATTSFVQLIADPMTATVLGGAPKPVRVVQDRGQHYGPEASA